MCVCVCIYIMCIYLCVCVPCVLICVFCFVCEGDGGGRGSSLCVGLNKLIRVFGGCLGLSTTHGDVKPCG